MSYEESRIGDLVLGNKYRLLQQIMGSLGSNHQYIGNKGTCRYCKRSSNTHFQKKAHTFPEALGNKWIFSLDECDACNNLFSSYESSLAESIAPFLTLGGVKGKKNKTRQTGRTKGDVVIKHAVNGEKRSISIIGKNIEIKDILGITATGLVRTTIPVPEISFVPRQAYKALAKMGFALLPDEELPNYQKLQKWLLDINDDSNYPNLEVAMSFGTIGNAPSAVCGSLLRRVNPSDLIPHILFIFNAGSVCLQIDLKPDHMDDHLPAITPGSISIKWVSVLGVPETGFAIIEYGDPVHQNWSSPQSEPQPIKSFVFEFNQVTCEGNYTPIYR